MVSHLQVCTYPRPVFINIKASDAFFNTSIIISWGPPLVFSNVIFKGIYLLFLILSFYSTTMLLRSDKYTKVSHYS
jgi:hypothetical protein